MKLDKTARRKELHYLADRLESDVSSYEGKFSFPLEHIIACMRDDTLQSRHSLTDMERYQESLSEPPENVVWVYFKSPAWTWENLCGRAGWMAVAKEPMREVAFFVEIMN
jgi:hypothetical protein